MAGNMVFKNVKLSLYDLNRLNKYEKRNNIIRKALDLFIEREKRTKKDTTQNEITKKIVCFGMDIKVLEYLKSISSNKKPDSQRYFTISGIIHIALRDFWQIEDSQELEPNLEPETPETRDYLERNGIKIIRIA